MGLNVPFWELDVSDDARAVFDAVQRLVEGAVRNQAVAMDRTGEFPRELYGLIGKTGCLAPRLPEELGGIGMSTFDYCRVIIMFAAESAATGNAVVSAGIAANYLYTYGQGRFDDIIRAYADATLVPAMALTEPGAGSDLRSLKTTATRTQDGYRLNGEKAWITKGRVCDRVMVLARRGDENGKGFVALLVDADSPGFERGKAEDLMGMRGLEVSGLAFNDVLVPDDQVIGDPEKGLEQTMQALSFGRILVASLAIGIVRGVLTRTTQYVLERQQFGRRIWDFQNTKFRIGEFSARLLAVESLLARASREFDAGREPIAEASAAKFLASDLAMEASTYAVQAHGAVGYSRDVDVERFMRDAKITQIYEGTNEIQRHLLAKQLVSA